MHRITEVKLVLSLKRRYYSRDKTCKSLQFLQTSSRVVIGFEDHGLKGESLCQKLSHWFWIKYVLKEGFNRSTQFVQEGRVTHLGPRVTIELVEAQIGVQRQDE